MKKETQGIIDIGKLVLQFSQVNRVTYNEDGVTPESDTDHTVMLSVCACAIAEKLYKGVLDIGKVAQFAIVHDLVEAYAQDTDTFGISNIGKKEKEDKEQKSLLLIKQQFDDVFPWIGETIESYEKLSLPEARFVKTLDKCMSQITHILNNGSYLKNKKISETKMIENYKIIYDIIINSYGKEFPELIVLLEELTKEAGRKSYEI